MDDVVLNKAEIIERCVRRVREMHGGDPEAFRAELTRQESVLLNLQRVCEAAIDLAMHLVRVDRLGIPKESRDAIVARHLDDLLAFASLALRQDAGAVPPS